MAQTDAVPQPEAVLPVIGDVAQPADDNGAEANPPSLPALDAPLPPRKGSRISRSVIPGLPRAQTFKRQLSEHRDRLRPIQPTGDERRAMSVDRRTRAFDAYPERVNPDEAIAVASTVPPTDEPRQQQEQEPQETTDEPQIKEQQQQDPVEQTETAFPGDDLGAGAAAKFLDVSPDEPNDAASIASAQEEFDAMIRRELETTWILNLSMRYKDQSNREKFFVSYRAGGIWRRVTVTVDYRDVPRDSLEMELLYMRYQRDKNARIYEDIRSSLQEIRFYETVTNLRLETRDDRLHVHVVEDANVSISPAPLLSREQCPPSCSNDD